MRARRVAPGALAAAGILALVAPAAAQPDTPAPWATALGGGELFVVPRVHLERGSLGLTAESLLGGGRHGPRGLAGSLSWRVGPSLHVRLAADRTRRSADAHGPEDSGVRESARDTRVGVGVHGARVGGELTLLDRRASLEELRRTATGLEARLWVDVGPRVGLAVRRTDVVDDGSFVERRVITLLDDWDFVSEERVAFLDSYGHTAVELDATQRVGDVRLTGVVGWGVSDGELPDRRWAHLTGVVPLSRHLELVLSGGRNGGLPTIGRAPATFARLGVRVEVGARGPDPWDGGSVPSARPAPAGTRALPAAAVEELPQRPGGRLAVVARGARTVEVRGDFTLWEPVALRAAGDGLWTLALEPGVFRFEVRVDGGRWTVPDGMPTVPDEFTGEPVAIAVVR